MKNVWILTEERPKAEVVRVILEKIAADLRFSVTKDELRVVPIFKDGRFIFLYKVEGVSSESFGEVFLKLASGNSSFVDFLVFLQKSEPTQEDTPLYAIEETKTDDSESRNTGVYQRCSKFVYVDFFYPDVKKIMLYNLLVPQKEEPTETNIFGMRLLQTMGVEVLGKTYKEEFQPFTSVEELATAKNAMRLPPAGNVAIRIEVLADRINVSGRLFKAGGLGHDPNIGALTAIARCIRTWEPTKDIVITQHALAQEHVANANNKFVQIAKKLNIKLDGLTLPNVVAHDAYWHYENAQEKVATILLHVMLIAYTKAEVIYSNHGGTERSYFIRKDLEPVAIEKYQEGKREDYKDGDKEAIIHIPDMIVYNPAEKEIIDIEGKKFSTRVAGIADLQNYDYIDDHYTKPSYKPKSILRTVVVFGSDEKTIQETEISFLLNGNGLIVLNENAPEPFKKALRAALKV